MSGRRSGGWPFGGAVGSRPFRSGQGRRSCCGGLPADSRGALNIPDRDVVHPAGSDPNESRTGASAGPVSKPTTNRASSACGETLEGRDVHAVLARFDARDRGVARGHPCGELFLSQAEFGTAHDHEARDALVGCEPHLGGAVRRVPSTRGAVQRQRRAFPLDLACGCSRANTLPILISVFCLHYGRAHR